MFLQRTSQVPGGEDGLHDTLQRTSEVPGGDETDDGLQVPARGPQRSLAVTMASRCPPENLRGPWR